MTTLAITGGTGFVGQHLLRMAVEQGHQVRALTRRAQDSSDGIAWVEGALDKPDSLAHLVENADTVIHVAGRIAGTRRQFEEANVTGTANMIEAARAAGVRRFIHISSLAAREPHLSDYGWSKKLSETVVADSGLDWTIIRPPAVYGPGDRETLELFKMAKRGFVALPPAGHFSVIHVADLCRLILALPQGPESLGQTYEPDDGREGGWEHRDFARTLGHLFDRRATTLSVPKPVLHGASALDRLFRRGNAKLTADRVRYFCHPDWVVTAHKRPPQRLWTPQIGTAAGLRGTAEWYLQQGWL
ncbi:NAD-dependent epimerase/dehydratase family protein [Allosphingosinicella vermicomposti]|uniref:NAD-dependent epimerase/dehydratase family protein n=1 Tax=Allosphingosinicella vermicomposti TaxID=614671 RepID=UPI000D0E7AC7|nr:NAD(P)H-binding protein [Allosphingosinicella vermicomposti]